MQKLLTIAIPTYNRENYLKQNLTRIFEQNDTQVEVLVCDNASPDNTQQLCEKYSDQYQNFTYLRNSKNLGYDLNVYHCLEQSNTKYVWFLSDDDFIDAKLIANVITVLNTKSPNGVLVNATVNSSDGSQILIENLGNCESDLEIIADDAALIKYSKWSSLISSIIIKRESIDRKLIRTYDGTCFIQLAIFWLTVANKEIIILGSQRIQKNDSKYADFNLNSSNIWLKSWVSVILSFDNLYTREACRKAATSLYSPKLFNTSSLFAHVVIAKTTNSLNRETLDTIISNVFISTSYRLLLRLLNLFNNGVIRYMFNIIKYFKA